MVVDNVVIDEKDAIKYLGVYIDRLLIFQEEKKHILKMAAVVKTIYTMRKAIPKNMKKLNLNALVLSNTQYSATIIQSIN